jgi:hypothetical protein
MEVTNQTTGNSDDLFDGQPKKLPGMLNVLTILTYIGCAIAYLSTIWGFIDSSNLDKKRAEFDSLQDSMGDNEMASKMMEGSLDIMQKSYDNRYILLISGLLFTTLCLVGAMQMRKLKKSGYPLYVIGEIAPVILSAILIGFSLVGGFMIILGAVIAAIFVILYSTQRKYLTN